MSNIVAKVFSFSTNGATMEVAFSWMKEDGGTGEGNITIPLSTISGTTSQVNTAISEAIKTYMDTIGFPLVGSDKVILFCGAV